MYKDKIPKDCYGCHRSADSHAGRFGAQCADCHDNDVWQPVKYDHLAKTKFALVGIHAKLDCHESVTPRTRPPKSWARIQQLSSRGKSSRQELPYRL